LSPLLEKKESGKPPKSDEKNAAAVKRFFLVMAVLKRP
jgi:hypothetical protein